MLLWCSEFTQHACCGMCQWPYLSCSNTLSCEIRPDLQTGYCPFCLLTDVLILTVLPSSQWVAIFVCHGCVHGLISFIFLVHLLLIPLLWHRLREAHGRHHWCRRSCQNPGWKAATGPAAERTGGTRTTGERRTRQVRGDWSFVLILCKGCVGKSNLSFLLVVWYC